MTKKTPHEIALLNEWTKRLGLQDWSISLETNCSPSEMKIPDSIGCTAWEESTKTAFIQIVNPVKITGLTREFDFEQVLIHELLHLKTCLLDSRNEEETTEDRILHQIIDDIARAMIDIKKTERAKHD